VVESAAVSAEPRHRKNAAEWVMWTALLPLVPFAWLIERWRERKETRHG
jgi:hypothetical protein